MSKILPFPNRGSQKELETKGGSGDSSGMPPDDPINARVAVLEHIAKETSETLKAIRGDLKDMRDRQERDFRIAMAWTFTMACVLVGIMAKGFKWF